MLDGEATETTAGAEDDGTVGVLGVLGVLGAPAAEDIAETELSSSSSDDGDSVFTGESAKKIRKIPKN